MSGCIHMNPANTCASCAPRDIDHFAGEYRFLSNFWPIDVWLDGVCYPSVEHAYQAAKTDSFHSRAAFTYGTPGEAKKRGQKIQLRPGWEAMKLDVMGGLLEQKFAHPKLRAQLAATRGRKLIEGNTWGDTFWGVCRGVGENHLGRLLMDIRDRI